MPVPGAAVGLGGAPVPEDRCASVTVDGRTVWVRRWGASAQRPWMTPATVVVEAFTPVRDGQVLVLALTNADIVGGVGAPGPANSGFDIADAELAKVAAGMAQRRGW